MADKSKRTVFVGGLPPEATEALLASTFSVFGQVLEVHLPREGGKGTEEAGPTAPHRGFGFLVFASTEAAEDAIDNMHLNEWGGKFLKVNFARPMGTTFNSNKPVWQDEEWIAKYGSSLTRQDDAPEEQVDAVPTSQSPAVGA